MNKQEIEQWLSTSSMVGATVNDNLTVTTEAGIVLPLDFKNMGSLPNQTEKEVENWLIKHNISHYTINKDLTVDIDGDVDLSYKSIGKLPIKFGKVTGIFNCYCCDLIMLSGMPDSVGQDFICSGNFLYSLQGCPQKVLGNFIATGNSLINLKGCPQTVKGNFICNFNEIKTLEGGPQEVGGDFNCEFNKLTSLVGYPLKVEGNFILSNNSIESAKDFNCLFGKNLIDKNNANPTPELAVLYVDNSLEISYKNLQSYYLKNKLDYLIDNKPIEDKKFKI